MCAYIYICTHTYTYVFIYSKDTNTQKVYVENMQSEELIQSEHIHRNITLVKE